MSLRSRAIEVDDEAAADGTAFADCVVVKRTQGLQRACKFFIPGVLDSARWVKSPTRAT